ncbi:MAG: hypothetical protein ABIF10_03345 [Candidatus Woesearchaeota archaeon]
MGVKYFLLCVAIIGILTGCRYTPVGDFECTPPAVKMLDVNGNTVCVLPEIEENETGVETEEVEVSEETPTGAVVAPIEPEVAPETPKVEPAPADVSGLPRKVVKEGELVNFPNLAVTDPDGDKITYTFTSPLDASGKWQTETGDAGEYRVTITASDGKNEISQEVLVVVQPLNAAPVLQPIADIAVDEGDTVQLEPIATDPDGDKVSFVFSGWMTSSSKKVGFDEAGEHIVTVKASDSVNEVEQDVKITVRNVNRQPIVAPLADITVTEGDKVVVEPTVADPDGEKLTVAYSEPLDSEGVWQTKKGDAGIYSIDITATDGKLKDTKSFKIVVKSLNNPPKIDIAGEIKVKEAETILLKPVVTDPEGDEVTVTYSGWMTSDNKKTTYEDAGEYIVTISATDGISKVTKDVKVIVENVNRPPEFKPGSFQ